MRQVKKYTILFWVLMGIVISSVAGSYTRVQAVTTKQKMAKQVCRIANQKRVQKGVGKLKLDAKLTKLANKRAKEIVKEFSHTRPDGRDCFSILDDNNISYRACGENVAAGQSTPKSVMNSWMHSEGHKRNILNSNFKKIGIGYCKASGSVYKYYWVQIFTD